MPFKSGTHIIPRIARIIVVRIAVIVAIRKLRTALKKYSAEEENEFLRMEFRRALYELRELGGE